MHSRTTRIAEESLERFAIFSDGVEYNRALVNLAMRGQRLQGVFEGQQTGPS